VAVDARGSARFRRYSFNNQLLVWAQATQRGMTVSRVAAFGTWRKLGYRVRAGENGLRIFAPVSRRLRDDEVAACRAEGRNPFDAEGRPRLVVRGFRVEYVFDVSQVDPGPDAQPLPETRTWTAQQGDAADGLWPALVALTVRRALPSRCARLNPATVGPHGRTNYASRTVWVNSACDEAERVRILAHETAGHIRCERAPPRHLTGSAGNRGRQRRLRGTGRPGRGHQLLVGGSPATATASSARRVAASRLASSSPRAAATAVATTTSSGPPVVAARSCGRNCESCRRWNGCRRFDA